MRPLRALVCASLLASCRADRAPPGQPPAYDADIAPLLAARCQSCHGAADPAAGWSAASYLAALGCVAPSNAPATLPASEAAPILAALDTPPHRGLLQGQEREALLGWVAAGTPGSRGSVHDPEFANPRSSAFHGASLRAARWAPMLDPTSPDACGRCHEGAPSRPAGVTLPAPGAAACTTCHSQPGGALACSTCHGASPNAYPPRDPCFFPADAPAAGAHAAHARPSALHPGGHACSTCHPTPADPVIGGLHGNGSVEISFDSAVVAGEASFDRQSGACAVTCHDRGGARPRPLWSDTQPMGCGDCHGSPPAAHYPGACNRCHAEANAAGTALIAGPLHLNGKVDLGDGSGECGACHGKGASPWPGTAAHPAHQNPTLSAPLDCSSCHVVPAAILDPGHLNGAARVSFSALASARGAAPVWDGARCSDVACHGARLADPAAVPSWSDSSGGQARCGACHGVPPTNHTPSTSCNRADCHGGEITLDPNGQPGISAMGRALHVDGIVESAH